ncbi:helix-turn-helix domain-containing protein, partial [Collinsella aerofaciens]|uniref:helix-turn-helix domain-containing protein n=2 Tax=Collinsella aerofaciens TaxID=74426 RepID=UPI00189863F8
MSGEKKRGPARAVPRAYGRLTRHERDTVQRMLERGASCREIARELGRSPSTVSSEVASHRFVTAPRARRGERVDASADLSAACPRLAAWPRCCNGCGRYRAIGCKRRPHVFYEARAAQLCADSVLVSSRRGIDADEPAAAARLEAIRDCLRRGLSPEQMAARNGGPVDLSPSTIYRWVSAGYDGMTNMELRRKVGYRPRKRAAGRAATRHSARRSYAAFLALGEDACAAAWEMDTVEGAREDSACLLTLLHRPSRLQLALPLEEKTAGCVADALEGVRAILGADGARRVFRAVLTDNGAEFSDEAAVAALLGEGPGETRLFYCDPRRSDQKGACERN